MAKISEQEYNRVVTELQETKSRYERLSKEHEDYKSLVARNELDVDARHRREIEDKEHEIKHFSDNEIKGLREQVQTLEREKSVLAKELEVTKTIVDLNADIIDVKDLVKNLIDKLPQINLDKLAVVGSKE